MSTFDYSGLQASATRLLNRFGGAATLKRQNSGAYDADNASVLVVETELSTVALLLEFDQKYIDGTLIRQGDKRALLDGSYVPVQGDRLTVGGIAYTIVAVREPVSGAAVVYECQVRGAGAAEASGELVVDGGGHA